MSDVNTLYAESEQLKDAGQLEEAISKLNEALAINADHALSHLALAVLFGRVGKHEIACEHGEKACSLEPNEAFNCTALSVTYQRAWQATQTQEYIAKAEDAMAKAHILQGTPGH
jgi:tetratricopeptide (TPR) repeat protein